MQKPQFRILELMLITAVAVLAVNAWRQELVILRQHKQLLTARELTLNLYSHQQREIDSLRRQGLSVWLLSPNR